MMECSHTFIAGDKWSLLWIWLCFVICITATHAAWFHRSPSVYYFSDSDKKFTNAQEECRDKGANLVTINGDGENQFLHNSRSDNRQHWIGLHCNIPCIDGNFQWYSGSSDFRNWAIDVNTNGGGYAVIYSDNAKWKLSNNPDNQKLYICEKADGCQNPDRPCENGATCVADESGGYTCICRAGFTERYCQTNINECNSDPCVHGGCDDGNNRYRCDCDSGYTGQHCETDIDECAEGGHYCVRDQGDCVNHEGGFTCACYDGYSGRRCWVNIDDCDPSPCQHEASCTDAVNAYTCTCTAFYTGTHCDADIDECNTPNFCNTGECENRQGDYHCSCNSGFEGDRCDQNIDECSINEGICQNSGTCTDTEGSYECTCEPGYTGPNCSVDINECSSSPCDNGATCHDGINHYTCECAPQFNGTRCEEDVNECIEYDYCGQWNCTNTYGDFRCDCPWGYQGAHCDIDIDECLDGNACPSHGNCTNHVGGFTCTCQCGYLGQIPSRVAKTEPKHLDFKDDTRAKALLATNMLTILVLCLAIGFIIITRKQWITRFHRSPSAEKRKSPNDNISTQTTGTNPIDAGDIKVEFDSHLYQTSNRLPATQYANVKDTAHQDSTYEPLGLTTPDEQPYELDASKLYTELRVASSK